MGLSSVIFILFSTALTVSNFSLAGSMAIKSLISPQATHFSYVEVTLQKPLSLMAFTLCMRVATELRGEREIILFAYRIPSHDELNVWRELDGRFSIYIGGEGVHFHIPELSSMQTQLCVTWDSSSGAAAFFINDKKSLTKIFKRGHIIRSEGRIVLGQDPDAFLGGFDVKQSFVGEILDVNLWDYVLSDTEVQDTFVRKRGNVIDWETTQLNINGEVVVVDVQL
ncbi:transcript variant X1 [Nothobranchius furzeri]|uniref:Pentraxin family member n=1 Tax=Nothobranchius furzeri TaxID=105023 RepID=A0A9D2XAM5_NOTFU|nr:transcript variant X1 [Nothobranchius furzeri]